MVSDTALMLAVFFVYLVLMVVIGVWSARRKTDTAADYFLGSREMGPFATALSAEASDMSAWMLMGLPGCAFLTGFQEAFWTALGLVIGTYLNWIFVAGRLHRFSSRTSSITIPEVFGRRFGDDGNNLRFAASLVTLFFFVIYVASAFISCSKLFTDVFGIPYAVSLIIAVSVIVAYTLMGGYRAVVLTDVAQGLLMFVAVVVTCLMAISAVGGFAAFGDKASAVGGLVLNPFADSTYPLMNKVSLLAWGIGYFGMPHILVRFMGIKDEKSITVSRRVAMIWLLIALSVSVLMGVVGRVCIGGLIEDSETVFIRLCKMMFPSVIAGVFLCGILASSMSSADSQLLVAASAFSSDIYKTKVNRMASDARIFAVSRFSVLVVAVLAVFLSMNRNSSIFNIVGYAWAGFGSTFAPVILFGLFWDGATGRGAVAALVSGAVSVVLWNMARRAFGGIFEVYELLPAFIIASVFLVAFSVTDSYENKKRCKEIFRTYIAS